jgi:hypothetical protein
VNGAATITIAANTLPGGYDQIQANYSGDADYAAIVSNAIGITVNPSGTIAPTLTVSAPTAASNFPILITVAVSGPAGDPTATGIVTLSGAVGLLQMPLVNGSAAFNITSNLNAGPNTISIQYSGDSNYTAKSSNTTVTLVAPVAIAFTPNQPTIIVNQPLTETITVTGLPNFATATGTVTLSSGSYNSGPIALFAGSASITVPANSLPIGSDTLSAAYSGDVNFSPGTNSSPVTVNPAGPPAFSLSATVVSVAPGALTGNTSTITATPSNGFTGSVILTAVITSTPSGAKDLPSYSFSGANPSQGSIGVYGTTPESTTITITTTPPSTTALNRPALPGVRWYQGGAALACLLLFGIPGRRRRWRTLLGVLAFLMFFTGGLISCGGSGSGGGGGGGTTQTDPGTTPGTYVISVTGTSTTLSTTTTVNVTVQ